MALHRSRLPAMIRAKADARETRLGIAFRAQGNVAYFDIYGDIGAGAVGAGDVLGALRGLTADAIELRINSQGGDAIEGLAIYNDLRANEAPKRVVITGIAASAASIIAMAGDHIAMADGASIMIHNAWCSVTGNANFLEKVAGELRGCDAAMCRIYSARTGIPAREITALMDAETLLTAAEAVDLGFADEVIDLTRGPQRFAGK